jgi:hypothetical protein
MNNGMPEASRSLRLIGFDAKYLCELSGLALRDYWLMIKPSYLGFLKID